MKKEKQNKNFIHKPFYPGGTKALNTFIRQNLKYPPEAIENSIQGMVKVDFDVDYQGKVLATRVVNSLGYGCDEEAERLVRMLKYQVAKNRNLKVIFHKHLNIRFRLPQLVATEYQYNLRKSPDLTGGKSVETKKETYIYKITI